MIPAGGWKWKWSNSVLKSEMGIFWCMSITNNVKSYKKFDGKAQTAKFTVLQGEISSTVLKTWKTRETETWFSQNFELLYPIQGTTRWKLTSWGFRKCGSFWLWQFSNGSYWLSNSKKILEGKNLFCHLHRPPGAIFKWFGIFPHLPRWRWRWRSPWKIFN